MKPHEETWTVRITNNGPIVYAGPEDAVCMVYCPSGRTGRTFAEAEELAGERAALIAAAPEGFRALYALLSDGSRRGSETLERHTMRCWDGIYAYHLKTGCSDKDCDAARAALLKARVLP